MKTVSSLPTEILHRIAQYSDQDSLRSLRLTHKRFSSISQSQLLHTVTLTTSNKSISRFTELLNDKSRAQLVRKVVLDTSKWDAYFDDGEYNGYETNDENDSDFDPDPEIVNLRKFTKLFDRLRDIPRLHSVVLRFHPVCMVNDDFGDCRQTVEFRSTIFRAFVSALEKLDTPIRELAIRDLQNVNETDPDVLASLRKILGNLRSLRLNIANEHNEGNGEYDLEYEEPHKFFPELSSIWLQPTLSNLKHLTLYSSNYFGYYPKCDLSGLHFPRLKTLALGNYAFIHDTQLDWILSHKTLQELYLDDCCILNEVAIYDKQRTYLNPQQYTALPEQYVSEKSYAAYDKRWDHYFRAFKDGLPRLRHFRYGHSQNWWVEDTTPFEDEAELTIGMHRDSYQVFCDGYGPSPYMKEMIWDHDEDRGEREALPFREDDQKALVELLDHIGQGYSMEDEEKRLIEEAKWATS
ncbi:hypothetical protein BDV25DRAFT_135350 [Aspergillus avenaceus]|uniref:F-box domain-containing protein n=1 Tax=Aspergillus avenaceus TaxID=36643 RepID=A0A5N6U8R0_ASPAV|nr:hypothetical protein BDV25DRAFT_135350 [Aspergillus avenaceus]